MRFLSTIFLCTVALSAQADTYLIDKEGQHAYIIFKASHLGFSYIIGHFEDFEGEFSYDPEDPSASSVNITIQTASLDSDHAERDKHLRGEQYLNADDFPEIVFSSTQFVGDANSGVLTGTLDFHGVTKSVDIAVAKIGEGKDPWGGYRSGFEGTTKIAAGDYGLPGWVGDIEIDLHVEGIRQ